MMHEAAYDADLWQQFKAGNERAFELLTQRNYRILYNYASKFSQDSEFIRDCLQELFLDLWDRRAFLHETAFVKPYLLKALRHKIIRESIRLKRFQSPEDLPFDAAEPVTPIEFRIIEDETQVQQIRQLHQLIAGLTKRQQEVVYLRFYQNLSNEEIAQIMGLNRQGVANLAYRTIKEIKENWAAMTEVLSVYAAVSVLSPENLLLLASL